MSYLAHYSENSDTLTLVIRKNNYDLMNEFLRLRCAVDMLSLNLFQNAVNPAKEITECMGLYKAARKVLTDDSFRQPYQAWCVGDGTRPRMGAMLAFRTNWNVWSVDPNLNFNGGIDRLDCLPCRIENVYPAPTTTMRFLFTCHSHAPMAICVERLNPDYIFAMPCCADQTPPHQYTLIRTFDDWGVLSPKREVFVWKLTK